jgi:hypothetical protein
MKSPRALRPGGPPDQICASTQLNLNVYAEIVLFRAPFLRLPGCKDVAVANTGSFTAG